MIRVFVADNHPLIRRMLRETLEREADMRVIGEAENTHQVMAGIKDKKPNILITNLSLRGRGSLNMIRDLKRLYPKLPVLVLTMHSEDRFAVQTLKLGASGYLTKDMPPEEIVKAIRTIVSGGRYIPASLAEKLAMEPESYMEKDPHNELSRREFEILCALASGKKTSDVAKEFSISVQTVNSHKSRIMRKMGMNSMPELTKYAVDNHLVER